jgi:hypothetical protein
MMKLNMISSQLLFTTTRIVARRRDGTDSVGTAFFFHFDVDGQTHVPVLVTNKHVVAEATQGEFLVHEASADQQDPTPSSASFGISLQNFEHMWVGHPGEIDLCAMPFEPLRQQALAQGKRVFYMPFDESLIPSQSTFESLSALEDIVMVGYPVGLWDSVNNLPIFRRGTTASHPAVDFGGKPLGLIDIASFPGSSGSPVLIVNEGSYSTPQGFVVGSRILLLGVLFAGPQFAADGTIEIVDIPTTTRPMTRTQIPIHLGYYIKASELLTLKRRLFEVRGIEAGRKE